MAKTKTKTKKTGKKPKVYCRLCGKQMAQSSINYHMHHYHNQSPKKDFNWSYFDYAGDRPESIPPTGVMTLKTGEPLQITRDTKTIKIPCVIEIPITIGEIHFTQE